MLRAYVGQFTQDNTQKCTDEWRGYNLVDRPHHTGYHARNEWARDDDGDGFREVHISTVEGMWAVARNLLRLFRGVHEKFLAGYLAICESHIDLKRITPDFIAALVASHL
jgi:transposase